jgi:hypothetical protein
LGGFAVQTFAFNTSSKQLVLEARLALANDKSTRKDRLMDVVLLSRELIAAIDVEDLTRCV